MSGTTATGLPFPTGTDLVVDGDDAIRALAEKITTQLVGRIEARSMVVTMGGTQSQFPFATAFASKPFVAVASPGAGPATSVVVIWDTVTATTFVFALYNGGTPVTTGVQRVNYIAVGL
jgi:hypothetical protein